MDPRITARVTVATIPKIWIGINFNHKPVASTPRTVAALATGPPHGKRFITPIAQAVRQSKTCGLIPILLYIGYIVGIVISTVVAVAPSRWAIIPIIPVATVIAITFSPAIATSLSTITSNTPTSLIMQKKIIEKINKIELLETVFIPAPIISLRSAILVPIKRAAKLGTKIRTTIGLIFPFSSSTIIARTNKKPTNDNIIYLLLCNWHKVFIYIRYYHIKEAI